MPVSDPPTAAERSGYRSPPMATIIGKMGPAAAPAAANAAIDTGSAGASTATATSAAMRERADHREPEVVEPVRDDRRDEASDGQARPEQRQRERRGRQRRGLEEAHDPVRDADLGGHVGRDRDPEQQERAGQQAACTRPARDGGHAFGGARRSVARWASGSRAYAMARSEMTAAVPTAMDCHGRPASTSGPTASGAARAPMLNDMWRRFMARPRPSRYTSSTRPLAPPSSAPAPVPADERRDDERRPARGEARSPRCPPRGSAPRRPARAAGRSARSGSRPPNDPDM